MLRYLFFLKDIALKWSYTPSQVIKLYVERYFKNTHKGFVDLLTLPLFQKHGFERNQFQIPYSRASLVCLLSFFLS